MEKYLILSGTVEKVGPIDSALGNGDGVAIRPMAVTRSMATSPGADVSGVLYVKGKFSPSDYTVFASDVVTPTGDGGSVAQTGSSPVYPPGDHKQSGAFVQCSSHRPSRHHNLGYPTGHRKVLIPANRDRGHSPLGGSRGPTSPGHRRKR